MAVETPRSRRQLLTAAIAAAGGALASRALTVADPVEAANGATVKVGQAHSGTAATTVTNTAASSSAVALKGVVSTTGAGGSTVGVWGQSAAQNGNGVFGYVTNSGSDTKGVWGRSTNGKGVYGSATGTSGTNYGVYGTSPSSSGRGVYGLATGGGTGVYGESRGNGAGVYGYGTDDGFGYGVTGLSYNSSGVIGSSLVSSGFGAGVYGSGYSAGGAGVYGSNTYSGTGVWAHTYGGWALYAEANYAAGQPEAYAGYFVGRTHVAGMFSKSSGTFLIDHPLDPANRTLAHSFVEAPEMLNIYRGTVTLNASGRATVRLPRYFNALNRDFSYQLTALDAAAPGLHVARRITRNSFAIAGGAPGQEVCWQVCGARQDAWAKAHPLRVDRAKRRKDRGKYLNPEVFGKRRSAGLDYQPTPKAAKIPRPRRRRNQGG